MSILGIYGALLRKRTDVLLDFLVTLLIYVIGFGLACLVAWREGRPLSAQGRKALGIVPYFGLGFAVYFATFMLWPPAGYEHPFVQHHLAGDAVFSLEAAGLAAIYARIAPAIYAAGAAHHPAQAVHRSAQELHMRRRVWRAQRRRAIPLFVLGGGVAALAFIHGVEIHHGGWVALSMLGAQCWFALVALGVRTAARRAIRRQGLNTVERN